MLTTAHTDLTPADLLRGDTQLATPPTIYLALKKVIHDPNKSIQDSAKIIEKDPALTARLLRIVNSAFYGFPAQITSIDRAINMIGYKELQSLVLGTIIIERFSDLPGTISMVDFWSRSLKCALITAEIDKQSGGEYHESAFVCGLLHDIGLLVFFRRTPELAREVNLLLRSEQKHNMCTEAELETQIIGFDHYLMGAELCRAWNLPDIIIQTIQQHHPDTNTHKFSRLTVIIREINFFVASGMLPDPKKLNIEGEQLSDIVEKALLEFEEIFKIFYPDK